MRSSTLRACICKNALAHRKASNVPILVGSTKGRLVTHATNNLRHFLSGKKIVGFCELTRSLLSTLTHPWIGVTVVMSAPFCQFSFQSVGCGRLQRTEHTLAAPSRRQEKDNSRATLPAPSTCPGPPGWAGARPAPWPWRTCTKSLWGAQNLAPGTTTSPSQPNVLADFHFTWHDWQNLTKESFPTVFCQFEFLTWVTVGHSFRPGRYASWQMGNKRCCYV